MTTLQIAEVLTLPTLQPAPAVCPACRAGRQAVWLDAQTGIETHVIYTCGAILDAPSRWTPCLAGWEWAARVRSERKGAGQ